MNKRDAIAKAALSRVGLGYIYGATGWVCTEARLQAQAKQYPAYADKIFYYGRKYWLNKVCYDCAQLTRRAAKDAGYSFVSGANSQWNMDIWSQKGTIDTLPDEKAIFLFVMDKVTGRMKHVAVTVGEGYEVQAGYEVEARGHAYGVVKRKIADCAFTHWARLRDIDGDVKDPPLPILRKGARGDDVKRLQTLLLAAGHALPKYGADGIFGAETLAALIAFQDAADINADGIADPLTWAALQTAQADAGEDGDTASAFVATIRGLTGADVADLLVKYPDAVIVQA